MIRQDLEATLDCQNGRVYIIPMELMNKLMKAGDDEDMAVLTAVLDGGGDMVHLKCWAAIRPGLKIELALIR
jgi:hypothetical protein